MDQCLTPPKLRFFYGHRGFWEHLPPGFHHIHPALATQVGLRARVECEYAGF